MNIKINELPLDVPKYVTLDVELFGAEKHRLHRPTGRFACLSLATSPEDVYIYTDEKIIPLVLGRIEDGVWVMHNAQFDIQQLRRWDNIPPRKKLWCTLLIEKALWSGYFDKFSLKDLARRHCSIYLEKETVEQFENATDLNDEMIHYSALDASITYQILLEQKEIIRKNQWAFNVYKKIDLPTKVFVFLAMTPNNVTHRDLANKISKLPGIYEVDMITGEYDLLVKVRGKNIEEIGKIVIDKIRVMEGVGKSFTSASFETIEEKI